VAESLPMTVANLRKLEAAQHRWPRKLLGISWKDKVTLTNEQARQRTGMTELENILKQKPLQRLGHVHHMAENRLAKQTLNWQPNDRHRKRG